MPISISATRLLRLCARVSPSVDGSSLSCAGADPRRASVDPPYRVDRRPPVVGQARCWVARVGSIDRRRPLQSPTGSDEGIGPPPVRRLGIGLGVARRLYLPRLM